MHSQAQIVPLESVSSSVQGLMEEWGDVAVN